MSLTCKTYFANLKVIPSLLVATVTEDVTSTHTVGTNQRKNLCIPYSYNRDQTDTVINHAEVDISKYGLWYRMHVTCLSLVWLAGVAGLAHACMQCHQLHSYVVR